MLIALLLLAKISSNIFIHGQDMSVEAYIDQQTKGIFKLSRVVTADITTIKDLEEVAKSYALASTIVNDMINYLRNVRDKFAIKKIVEVVRTKSNVNKDEMAARISSFVDSMRNVKTANEDVEALFSYSSFVYREWEKQLVQEQLDVLFGAYTPNVVQKCHELTQRKAKIYIDFRLKTEVALHEIKSNTGAKLFGGNVSVAEHVDLVSNEQINSQLLHDANDYLLTRSLKCDGKDKLRYVSESLSKYPLHIPVYETWLHTKDNTNGLSLPFDIVEYYTKLMTISLSDYRQQLYGGLKTTNIEVKGAYEIVGKDFPLMLALRSEQNGDYYKHLTVFIDQVNEMGRLVIALLRDELKKRRINTQMIIDKNRYSIEDSNWSFEMSAVDKLDDVRLVLGFAKTGDENFDAELLRLYVGPMYYDARMLCGVNKRQAKIDFGSKSFINKSQKMMTAQLSAGNEQQVGNVNNIKHADYDRMFTSFKILKQQQIEADMAAKNLSVFQVVCSADCYSIEVLQQKNNKAIRSYNPMTTRHSLPYGMIEVRTMENFAPTGSLDMITSPRNTGLIVTSNKIKGVDFVPLLGVAVGALVFIFIIAFGLYVAYKRKRDRYRALRRDLNELDF